MTKLINKMIPIVLLLTSVLSKNAIAQQADFSTERLQEQGVNQDTDSLKYSMVGYLESWGTISIEEAVAHHYNVLVIAFGTIEGKHVGMNLNCGASLPEGCFLPSVNWSHEPPVWKENFKKSIELAHSKGIKVLLSVGGANNTFKPGVIDSKTLAESIVGYLTSLNLDGIDFDLENISTAEFPGNATERQEYIDDLIKQIKLINNKTLITSAPQINPVQGAQGLDIQFVNTGSETVYNKAIANNLFDYIFAQAYNTPGFSVDNHCVVQWQNANDEMYPVFISKIAPCLEKLLPKGAKAKIMIGEPANSSNTAGHGALDNGTYSQIANEYKKNKGLPSFGGAMTWSINEDSKTSDDKGPRTPYSFSSALWPILSK